MPVANRGARKDGLSRSGQGVMPELRARRLPQTNSRVEGSGRSDGPCPSRFGNAKLLSQNCLSGRLLSTSIMQFPIGITGCVWKEIGFEMLLCNHITFLWICEWASDTFSGFRIADETAASQGTRRAMGTSKQPTRVCGRFWGPTQNLGALTTVPKVTSVSCSSPLPLPPAVPAERSGWRSPLAHPAPTTSTPRSPVSPPTAPAPP